MPSGAFASAIVSPILRSSMPEMQTMSPADASSTSMRSSPANVSSVVSRSPAVTLPSRAILAIGSLHPRASAEDAPDADPPDVAVVVDRRDQQLERALFGGRFGDARDDRFEERLERVALVGERALGDAGFGVGEDHRKVGLLVVGAELDEEVEGLVDDLLRAGVFAVDLVDHDDRAQVELERLLQNEARLRHDAFGGVDQQQHALHHLQHALDLAAEVGVAGRVDDVELDAAVANGRVLGENRNAALALERIGIEHARNRRSCPSRKTPLCLSIASTSVVLPWSTWAMMATLRISERVFATSHP